MEQEVVVTRNRNIAAAVEELCGGLKCGLDSYQAVIFLAATDYDFGELSVRIKEKFPEAEVIGASTAGEITGEGFSNGCVVLTTMRDSGTKVSGVFIDRASRYPAAYKDDIEAALRACGIQTGSPVSHRDAFALEFTNTIYNAEETVLSTFYSIIRNDKFRLAGASAGYTGGAPRSYVCYNGRVTQDGAVMLFVKTRCKFDIRQETMYNPVGRRLYVSSAEPSRHEINTINGVPAVTAYSRLLEEFGVRNPQAPADTMDYPLGRFLDGSLHIAALRDFTPDNKIGMYSRVIPNSTLELMKLGDPLAKADETCAAIRQQVPAPKFVFLMTCLFRTLTFERLRVSGQVIEKYKKAFPLFCGFTCYGEQIDRVHCSQTLVSLVIGD